MKSTNAFRKSRSGPLVMRIVSGIGLILAVLLLSPRPSAAVSVTGDSNTYLQSRENEDKQKLVEAYEYLNFSVQDAGSITFHVGGWLRYDLGENSNKFEEGPFSRLLGQRGDSDLQYGYLSYRSGVGNGLVNLGRVLVSEGVAAERVDGIYARTDLAYGFGVSAFGGRAVDGTVAIIPGNNTIYGGRVSHQIPGLYRIGLSALREENGGTPIRKEEGIDLWVRPMNKVELTGNSKYNEMGSEVSKFESTTADWASHRYVLVLGPFTGVRLNTEASAINYQNYFTATTTPVFRFDPTVIDPNEKVHIWGEEVAYDVTDKLNVSVNYKAFRYNIAGDAKYYGGAVRYAYARGGNAGLSVAKMDGGEDRLQYKEYRIYSSHKYGKTDVVVDALDVNYTTAINGVKDAYSVSLAAAYELSERLKVGADVEYSKNPDFDKDIRTMAKLTYTFDIGRGSKEAK